MKYNIGDNIRVFNNGRNSLNGKIVEVADILIAHKGYLVGDGYFISEDEAYPPITKFHVGDMVKVFDGREIEVDEDVFTNTMKEYIGNIYKVSKVVSNGTVSLEGVCRWLFSPSWLGLIEPANTTLKYEINIISDGECITSSFKEGNKIISTFSAPVAPVYESSKSNYKTVIDRWCDKLFEKKEEVFNGKVVCVSEILPHETFTKGKVYEFKNGFSKFDIGTIYPKKDNPIKNLKDLNDRVGSHFEMYDESKLNGKFVYIGMSSCNFVKGKIYTVINSKIKTDTSSFPTNKSELENCFVRLVED